MEHSPPSEREWLAADASDLGFDQETEVVIVADRCQEHESGGVQCELEFGHLVARGVPCACPKALERWLQQPRGIPVLRLNFAR